MQRRDFLKLTTISTLSWLVPGMPGWAFSNGKEDQSGKKLIVILLRGAVDGLNVVVPYGDSAYYSLRPTIAVQHPGSDLGVISLDSYFGLHPALQPLVPFWEDKSLAFVHASGSPDPSRSHFDAQDYMESGVPGSKSVSTGWLNRLVLELPVEKSSLQAVSIGPVLPKICSGPASVATISKVDKANRTVLDKPAVSSVFQELYSNQKDEMGKAFAEGVSAHKEINQALTTEDNASADQEQMIANKGAPLPQNYPQFGRQLAQLFRKSPSIQVAFLDFGGWDTHVNQGAGKGQLANHLTPLALGLADLAAGLGNLYKDSTIVVMSEFGRTAKENGNGGTDHGHGNAIWLLGGNIPGGKVYGRWAGLSMRSLHESRDLPTTTDFRSVLGSLLHEHLGVSSLSLAKIFPEFQNRQNPFVQV
jgi:uncharacterized protein (DUF1501 family)